MQPASEVAVVYPKLYHNWSSRLGITTPDVVAPMSCTSRGKNTINLRWKLF